jgi:lipopolysaccharide export system protein LptA
VKYGCHYRWRLSASALFTILLIGGVAFARAQQPSTSAQLPVAIGDIRISHFASFRTNLRQLRNFVVSGKNIVVATTDPSRPLRFYLVVNGVVGHAIGPKGSEVEAELEGPIQFRVVRKVGQEQRTLEGTAGHARYNEQTQQLSLSDGVVAKLFDPSRLEGPATVHVDSAVVATDKSGRLQLSGRAGTDSLTFVPKMATPKGGALPRHRLGTVQVIGFTRGDVDLPHAVQLSGSPVQVTFDDVVTKAKGTLSADLLEAYFAQNHLVEIAGQGDVRFHGTEPDARNRLIILEGRADRVHYEAAQSQVSLETVEGTLQIPQKLQGPAHIQVARLVAQLGRATTYLFYGEAGRDSISFSPQPSALPVTQGEQARPISVGTVEVSGFEQGEFVPGKRFHVEGKRLTIQTSEPQTGFESRIESQQIEGVLSPTNEVVRMATQGEVQCRFVRPYHPAGNAPNPPQPSDGKEIVEAKAASLVYTNTAQTSEVVLQGPTQITAQSPALAGPVRYLGAQGDTVAWNLRSDDLVIASPQSTARIEAVVPPPANPKLEKARGKRP